MKSDPQRRQRHSVRLPGYDYSLPGAYFVTIVTHQRQYLFGEISGGAMHLNRWGKIVEQVWLDLRGHYPCVVPGAFCIMPNHVHGVIGLCELEAGPAVATKRRPLSEIVRGFKSFSARQINELRQERDIPVWQRNYYEHIIRDDVEHERIHRYIESNPANWVNDEENLARLK